ncbi:hypothetical protein [Marinobacterium aestuariivivens]|uniref:Uncharacterized protein n=1 Tax=Marinobacterium aestuariivivens TaxID=1698799 RepID=A0ABW2A826_9GAMM
MFNGLDELEDFASRLAPLTPEEAAAWKQKKASAETGRTETQPVSDNAADAVLVHVAAPAPSTVPKPVIDSAADPEPPPVPPGPPETATAPERGPELSHKLQVPPPEPADERERKRETISAPVQKIVPNVGPEQPAEAMEAKPLLITPESELEQVPGSKRYTRYVVVAGLLLLCLVTLLI